MESVIFGNNNGIIGQFINNELSQTTSNQLERIQKTRDVLELLKFSTNTTLEPVVRKAALKKQEVVSVKFLSKQKNILSLSKFYSENFFYLSRDISDFKEQIKKMLVQLYSTVDNIDVLLGIRNELAKLSLLKSEHMSYHLCEDRIVEIVKIHPNRKSFNFLINIWKQLLKAFPASEELATLMPESLRNEKDLTVLPKYFQETFNRWNHHENGAGKSVLAQIRKVLVSPIDAKNFTIEVMDEMIKCASFYGDEKTRNIVVWNISKTITKQLHKETDVNLVLEYQKKVEKVLYNRYGIENYIIMKSFGKILLKLTPNVLKDFNSAEQVFEYNLKTKIHRHTFPKLFDMVNNKLEKLIPVFFKKNPDLTIAATWYMEEGYFLSCWDSILPSLIANEENLFLLDSLFNTSDLRKFKNNFKERIIELIFKSKEPDAFFLKCIKEEKFFDNKELFLEKAHSFIK